MAPKGKKRKSAPAELQRSTPQQNGDFMPPPSRRDARRSSMKTRSVTESQDTLTQMQFVTPLSLLFDDHAHEGLAETLPQSSRKKRRTVVQDSDDEEGHAPRKKASSTRKSVQFEVSEVQEEHGTCPAASSGRLGRRSTGDLQRQKTLTQMDFGKLLGSFVADSDDEQDIEEMFLADTSDNIVGTQALPETVRSATGHDQAGDTSTCAEATIASANDPTPAKGPNMHTPKKKFRDKKFIPSSQSPADSHISTQSPLKDQSPLATCSATKTYLLQPHSQPRSTASPLKERSPNVKRLSISPTKFHVKQFNERLAAAGREKARQPMNHRHCGQMVRSSTANSENTDLLENDENQAPWDEGKVLSDTKSTQASIVVIDLNNVEDASMQMMSVGTDGDHVEDVEKVSESPVKAAIIEKANKRVQTAKVDQQPNIPTSEYPDARFFWQHEPSWRPEFTSSHVEALARGDTYDSPSEQLFRETQVFNERIRSSQGEEPERVPSSQETSIALPTAQTAPEQHSAHRLRPSQVSTLGSALVSTPHRSHRTTYISPTKQSPTRIPSSPAKQSGIIIPSSPSVKVMPPPPLPGAAEMTPRTRRVRSLRARLLDFDYEDDPMGVSQILQDSGLEDSLGLPPVLSSPIETQK